MTYLLIYLLTRAIIATIVLYEWPRMSDVNKRDLTLVMMLSTIPVMGEMFFIMIVLTTVHGWLLETAVPNVVKIIDRLRLPDDPA